MKKMLFVMSTVAASTFAMAAHALPVTLTYQGFVSGSGVANATDGDSLSVSMVFDNGGTDLLSQSWSASDFVSASASTSGGYSLFGNTFQGGVASVQTDAAGLLSFLNVSPLEFAGSDTNGQLNFEIFLNGQNNIVYYTNVSGFQIGPSFGGATAANLTNTSISIGNPPVSNVPLPAALPLLLAGLGLLGFSGRRKTS